MSTEYYSLSFALSVFHGNMIMTLCGYGYGCGAQLFLELPTTMAVRVQFILWGYAFLWPSI